MKRTLHILLGLLLFALPLQAETDAKVDGFLGRIHPNGMPYRLFIPEGYNESKQYPLVLWLHGSGAMGKDNLQQISGDNAPGTHFWTTPENQAKHPAFVVAPQCAETADLCWDNIFYDEPEDQMMLVLEILDTLQVEFNIDPGRIYVAGQSMGGYGTWDIITKRPDLFAAAIPICGGGNAAHSRRIAHLPVWAFHGDADSTVSVSESRRMIAAMREGGGDPKYTEYRGMGHDIWNRVFQEPALADWLFSQHR